MNIQWPTAAFADLHMFLHAYNNGFALHAYDLLSIGCTSSGLDDLGTENGGGTSQATENTYPPHFPFLVFLLEMEITGL